jgi:hypothetical protein
MQNFFLSFYRDKKKMIKLLIAFFIGLVFTQPSCFGYDASDPLVCSGHGNCTASDTCICESGYYGYKCQYEPTLGDLCDFGHECAPHETCLGVNCACFPEYQTSCIDKITSYTAPSCSSDFCTNPNYCEHYNYCDYTLCDCSCSGPPYDYFGQLCKVYECYDYHKDHFLVCNNKGTCVGPNNCTCDTGYIGDDCSIPISCFGIPYYDSTVCSGHGDCTALDNCVCDAEHTGDDCSIPISCFGIPYYDSTVCNGHGDCTAPDNCVCDAYYFGVECKSWTCFGIPHIDPDVCSGNGVCIVPDTCACTSPYTGMNCQGIRCDSCTCFGYIPTHINACNFRGVCVAQDNCICDPYWYGDDCWSDKYTCYNIPYDDPTVCNGNGVCTSSDTCVCDSGCYGDQCDLCECQYQTYFWDVDPVIPNPDPRRLASAVTFEHPSMGIITTIFGGTTTPSLVNGSIVTPGPYESSIKVFKHSDRTWSLLYTPVPQPIPRIGATVVRIGRYAYIFGGYNNSGVLEPTVEKFDLWAGMWVVPTTIPNQPTPRFGATASLDSTGRYIRIFDGASAVTTETSVDVLDTVAVPPLWGLANPHTDPRVFPTSERFPGTDDLFIFGGIAGGFALGANTNVDKFDGVTGIWTLAVTTDLSAATAACSYLLGEHPVFIFGGFIDSFYTRNLLYNLDFQPNPRYGATIGSSNDNFYIFGGEDGGVLGSRTIIGIVDLYTDSCSCFGYDASDPLACSSHGVCVSNDVCVCESGWTGTQCDEWTCYGIGWTDPTVCSGNGHCVGVDDCSCEAPYFGDNCDLFTCFEVLLNETSVCSGHGTCFEPDTCVCACCAYYGLECDLWPCYGIFNNDSNVCSGHGTCVSFDNCTCDPGYYIDDYGVPCNAWDCYGLGIFDPNVCSGRGVCIAPDTCFCDLWVPPGGGGGGTGQRYQGDECDAWYCGPTTRPGPYNNTDPRTCSGHGDCVGFYNCSCDVGYSGDDCGIWYCNRTLYNDTEVCSGHGTCVSPDNCTCDPGYYIDDYGVPCNAWDCYGLGIFDPNVCSGRGDCIAPDTCFCYLWFPPGGGPGQRYQGDECDVWICGPTTDPGPYNNTDPRACSGHGDCVDFFNCSCDFGCYGDQCENCEPPPPTCDLPLCKPACFRNARCVTTKNDDGFCVSECVCKDGSTGLPECTTPCQSDPCEECEFNLTKVCVETGEGCCWEELIPDPNPLTDGGNLYVFAFTIYDGIGYVFGGERLSSGLTNDLWKCHLESGLCEKIVPSSITIPSARQDAKIIGYDGKLYLFGGIHASSPHPTDLHYFDIATNQWHKITTTTIDPPYKYNHAMVISNNGILYVHSGSGGAVSEDFWMIDLNNLAPDWVKIIPSSITTPGKRHNHGMVEYDNFLYMYGGNSLTDLWRFNTSSQGWYEITPLVSPPARVWTPIVINRGSIYLYGGATFTEHLTDMWKYSILEGGDWEEICHREEVPIRNHHHVGVYNNSFYVVGGRIDDPFAIVTDFWKFDLGELVCPTYPDIDFYCFKPPTWECNGIDKDNSTVCSGNGECVKEDDCKCYDGATHGIINRRGGGGPIPTPTPEVCQTKLYGGGACSTKGTYCSFLVEDQPFIVVGGVCDSTLLICDCIPEVGEAIGIEIEYYNQINDEVENFFGRYCKHWSCGDKHHQNIDNVCSGHGACLLNLLPPDDTIDDDTAVVPTRRAGDEDVLTSYCECQEGYSGEECEEWTCDPECVHGECIDINVCECECGPDGAWIGEICDIPVEVDGDGECPPEEVVCSEPVLWYYPLEKQCRLIGDETVDDDTGVGPTPTRRAVNCLNPPCEVSVCNDLAVDVEPNTPIEAVVCNDPDDYGLYFYEATVANELPYSCYKTILMWVDPVNKAEWYLFGRQIHVLLKKAGHSGHIHINTHINGVKVIDGQSAHDKIPKLFAFRWDGCEFDSPRLDVYFGGAIRYHYNMTINSTQSPLLELLDYNRGEYYREIVVYNGYLTNWQIKEFLERPIGVPIIIARRADPGEIPNKPPTFCRNATDFDYKKDLDELANFVYSKFNCFGIPYNEHEYVCSGHGTCYKWNKCDCDYEYGGSQCQDYVPTCNGIRFDDPFVCSGNGVCLKETKTCDCKIGYTGIDCEYAICNSYTNEDPEVCSGYGSCYTPDFCTCDEGYDGVDCEECAGGYTGYPNCSSVLMCFGLAFDDESVCSGHGECIEPDNCECNCMYDEGGEQCEISSYGTEGWRLKKFKCRQRTKWRLKCKNHWTEPICTLMFHDPAWLN